MLRFDEWEPENRSRFLSRVLEGLGNYLSPQITWLDIHCTSHLSVNRKWCWTAAKWYQRKFCSLYLLNGNISQCLRWLHNFEYRRSIQQRIGICQLKAWHTQSFLFLFLMADDHISFFPQYLHKSQEGLQEVQYICCFTTLTIFHECMVCIKEGMAYRTTGENSFKLWQCFSSCK